MVKNAKFKHWECNAKNMQLTKNSNALYMHCLPADISRVSCKKEGEVAAEVFEKYRSETYHEASFKPMIFLTRTERPWETLDKLIKRDKSRRI